MFWTLKMSFVVNILEFSGFQTVLATFFLKWAFLIPLIALLIGRLNPVETQVLGLDLVTLKPREDQPSEGNRA
jgi:hypothetical protein